MYCIVSWPGREEPCSEIVSNELTHVEVQSRVTLILNGSIKSLVNGE